MPPKEGILKLLYSLCKKSFSMTTVNNLNEHMAGVCDRFQLH